MKKISYLFFSSALLASGAMAASSMADGPMVPVKGACNFSGWYAGATIGYGSHRTKVTGRQVVAGATENTYRTDLSLEGANGGLFLGYGKEWGCSRVYLGLEFGYFIDGSKGHNRADAATQPFPAVGHLEVKRKDGLELSARLGMVFNNSMPYIKLGWANTKVEGKHTVLDVVSVNDLHQKFLHKRVNGFLAGAGIDIKLSRCLIAGLEYIYTNYQKKRGHHEPVSASIPLSSANHWDNHVRLNENKFRLRLAYNF